MNEDLELILRDAAHRIPAAPLPSLDDAAAAAVLLDVAYATLDSPVGTILLAGTPRGLVRIAYLDDGVEEPLRQLALRVSPRVIASPRRLDEPRRELEQYFAGRRHQFELAIDWQLTRGFGRRVLEATARIPFGTVSTYGRVAAAAGSPRGSRADRQCPGHQSASHRRAVPSGRADRRRAGRLHRRTRAQAHAAGGGGRGGLELRPRARPQIRLRPSRLRPRRLRPRLPSPPRG